MAFPPHRHTLKVQRRGAATVVHFPGQLLLDSEALQAVREQLATLAEEAGQGQVLVNLANVAALASTVLAALMTLHTKVQTAGGSLVLCNIEPPLDEVFKTSRLDKFFHIAGKTNGLLAGKPARSGASPDAAATASNPRPGHLPNRPVVVCDPDPARAEQLVAALAPALSVVHCPDLGTFAQAWRKHRPAAVALPLQWPAAGPAFAASDAPVLQFLREHGRDLAIIPYAATSRLPLADYCRALAAGARQVLNEDSPTFADDLRQTLTRLVRNHQARSTEQEELTAAFAEHGLIGQSPALREVFRRALRASQCSDLPLLIDRKSVV